MFSVLDAGEWFPMVAQDRSWLLEFMNRFAAAAAAQWQLRPEVFLESRVLPALRDSFLKTARQFSPILGWGRRPGAKLPSMPTDEAIQEAKKSQGKPDLTGVSPDQIHWFLKKADGKQREIFQGHGGLTVMFLKADPNTAAPKFPFDEAMRKRAESIVPIGMLEELLSTGFGIKDGFLAKSKELFGKGLEDHLGFKGIPFILPLLQTEDFFSRPAEECEAWFQVFDIYVRESPNDKGIVFGSKIDVEESLIVLLKKMKEDGLVYGRGPQFIPGGDTSRDAAQ